MCYKYKANKPVLRIKKKKKKANKVKQTNKPFPKFQRLLNFIQAQLLLGNDPEVKPNHSKILNDDSTKDTVMT